MFKLLMIVSLMFGFATNCNSQTESKESSPNAQVSPLRETIKLSLTPTQEEYFHFRERLKTAVWNHWRSETPATILTETFSKEGVRTDGIYTFYSTYDKKRRIDVKQTSGPILWNIRDKAQEPTTMVSEYTVFDVECLPNSEKDLASRPGHAPKLELAVGSCVLVFKDERGEVIREF